MFVWLKRSIPPAPPGGLRWMTRKRPSRRPQPPKRCLLRPACIRENGIRGERGIRRARSRHARPDPSFDSETVLVERWIAEVRVARTIEVQRLIQLRSRRQCPGILVRRCRSNLDEYGDGLILLTLKSTGVITGEVDPIRQCLNGF